MPLGWNGGTGTQAVVCCTWKMCCSVAHVLTQKWQCRLNGICVSCRLRFDVIWPSWVHYLDQLTREFPGYYYVLLSFTISLAFLQIPRKNLLLACLVATKMWVTCDRCLAQCRALCANLQRVCAKKTSTASLSFTGSSLSCWKVMKSTDCIRLNLFFRHFIESCLRDVFGIDKTWRSTVKMQLNRGSTTSSSKIAEIMGYSIPDIPGPNPVP